MKVGTLLVDLALNTGRLAEDMKAATRTIEGGVRDVQRSVRSARNQIEGILAATGVSLLTRQMVEQARQAEQAQNRLSATLRATGMAASFTRAEVDEMAESLAKSTQFDDEGYRNAASNILKFGNIHGRVFREALKLSGDLAAFLGTDVPEAAQMIGRTLQSPTEGLGMMERQFGKLSDAEEGHIKQLVAQGKAIEAQTAVLELWRQKVGGVAQEMNTGLTQSTTGVAKAWDDMLESMGRTESVGGVVNSVLRSTAGWLREIEGFAKGPGPLASFESQLAGVTAEIARIERSRPATGRSPLIDARLAELRGEQGGLQDLLGASRSTAVDLFSFDPKSLEKPVLGGNVSGRGGKTAQDLIAELSGVDKDFTKELLQLHEEYARGALKLDAYREAVRRLIEKQEFSKRLNDENRKILELSTDALRAEEERMRKRDEVITRANSTLGARRRELELELQLMPLTGAARERELEFRRIDLQMSELAAEATAEQIKLIERWGAEAKRAYDDAADAKQRLLDQDARISGALEKQREIETQAQRSHDVVEQAIANGIMAGFRRAGPGFAEQFRHTLEDSIATAALTPVMTRIAAPFGNLGSALAGQGSMFRNFAGGIATSGFGQRMGWSTAVEDASGNVTYQPTDGYMSAASNAPGWIGMAIAAAGALRSRESRYQTDDVFREYEAKLPGGIGRGAKRGQFNPFGGWMEGTLSTKEAALGMAAPGLFRFKGDTRRSGEFGGVLGAAALGENRWFDGDVASGAIGLAAQINAQEQNLMRNWNVGGEQLAAINARIGGMRGYDFGMERTPWEESQAFQQIRVDRMSAISEVLGRSIEDLTRIMSLSAEQFADAMREAEGQLADMRASFGEHVRGLPGQLGISALQDFKTGLTTSEFLSPMDRLQGARTSFADTLSRARGGDLEAVRNFPDVAQQLLGVGRDVYASGPEFQNLFRETNVALSEVLQQQESLRLDILKDVPQTILDASRDEIGEMKRQTDLLLEAFSKLTTEVRLLRAA